MHSGTVDPSGDPVPVSAQLHPVARPADRAPNERGPAERRPAGYRSPKHRAPGVALRTVRRATTPAPRALLSASERGSGTLVLVAGSVGTGKTTLLADWAAELVERGELVGWAALDREDNDPQVMAETLLGALRAAVGDVLPATEDESEPIGPGRAFVGRLTELAAGTGLETWLVLDDLHLVRDPRCLELAARLVRWAPPHLHVIVGTRADPGLHLDRLRLEERLVEVREHQLRFSIDDTRELLLRHGLALDDNQLQQLQQLTEGWAAGVALAAVSLAQGRDTDDFLREFARSHRAMSGYLVEEVLAGLDEPTRDFLLVTSVLEDLTADLAAAVTGRDDAGSLLDSLSADNAMVSADRVGTPTYRYHVLLRSYLGAMLEARSLRRAREVHARAAQWYAAHRAPGQALRHAEAAGDLDLVSDVIHHHALHLLLDGRAADVEAAVRAVDGDGAVMTAVGALASLDLSDAAAARAQLSRVARRAADVRPRSQEEQDHGLPLDRLVTVALRWLSFTDGGHEQSLLPAGLTAAVGAETPTGDVDRSARGSLSHAESDLALLDDLTSGKVLMGAGRFDEARTAFGAALSAARTSGHLLPALQAMVGLASVASTREDLVEMTAWSERVLAESQGTPWVLSPRLLPAHVFAGWGAFYELDDKLARERNRVALVVVAAAAGAGPVDSSQATGGASGDHTDAVADTSTAGRGLEQLARLARLLEAQLDLEQAGDQPGVRREITTRVMAGTRETLGYSMTPEMALGELSQAHRIVLLAGLPRLAAEIEDLCAGLPRSEAETSAMAGVRHLRSGDDVAARAAAAPLVAGDPGAMSLRAAVTAHLVVAVVAHRNGQPTVAHEELVRALGLAASQGAARMVLEVAPDVMDLLSAGVGRFGALEPFVARLLARPRDVAQSTTGDLLDVALSHRELSLLRELPSLLTVAEIAVARAVSRNTVKTQMRSVFQKLGVGSRREAVAAGRRLGLL